LTTLIYILDALLFVTINVIVSIEMVLTRRAAKKQLEEEEKKESILTGCQDAKTAEQDAENVQPPMQKKVLKARAVDFKRESSTLNKNQRIFGTLEKDQNQGSPARTSPLPVSPASRPFSPTLKITSPLNEAQTRVVDNWEDIGTPEGSTKKENLAMVNNQVALQSTTATTPPIPAFIAALSTKNTAGKKELKAISNPLYYAESKKGGEIGHKNEEKKTVDSSPFVAAAKASSPKQESSIREGVEPILEATTFEREQNSGQRTKTQKQKFSKEKGFTALHNTRKDHGLSTKFKAPAPHHQDIIHPAPADLVEAVQTSADSLQAQLDALTLGGPSNTTSSGTLYRQPVPSSSSSSSIGTPYFQRNPETTASVANHLAALSSQLHRLTLCVGILQQEIAAAAIPQIPDAVDRHYLALDTCALMHRSPTLDAFINVLIKQKSNASKFVSVLVPLEIVRELDGLKESRDEKRRSSARKAISLLKDLKTASNGVKRGGSNESSLEYSFPLYRGQRQNELLGPQARRGDDGILDCMILFKNAGAAEINLVTQDHNFALRADTEGFPAMTVAQALDFVTSLSGNGSADLQAGNISARPAAATTPSSNLVPLPLSFVPSIPCDVASKQEKQEELMKTPNAKQQQQPSSPTLTFTIPLAYTPQPPLQKDAETPEAPQTVAAGVRAAAAATTPLTFKKWRTSNGALVRPPGLTAKQWKRYSWRHFQNSKRQMQSAQKRHISGV